MDTISGIYGKANVFSNDIEDYAKAQLKMICDNPISQNSSIKIMPIVGEYIYEEKTTCNRLFSDGYSNELWLFSRLQSY